MVKKSELKEDQLRNPFSKSPYTQTKYIFHSESIFVHIFYYYREIVIGVHKNRYQHIFLPSQIDGPNKFKDNYTSFTCACLENLIKCNVQAGTHNVLQPVFSDTTAARIIYFFVYFDRRFITIQPDT